MANCPICDQPAHPGSCSKPAGLTGQEMADAERRFLRGLRRADGRGVIGPLDPGDTRDLWEDGW